MKRGIVQRAVSALIVASTAAAQGKSHAVHGTILDGSNRTGLVGALVQIQNASTSASARSDDEGKIRLNLPAGRYQLIVRRIGYEAVQQQIALPDSGSEFTISLRQQAQRLSTVRVGAKGAGIWGIVMSGELNRAMPYAKVQVAGSGKQVLTDSIGSFFFDVPPGRYMVRIGRSGYATEMFPVEVAKDQVVDASTILDKSRVPDAPGFDGLIADLDERLKWIGKDGAFLTGTEIRKAGSNVIDAAYSSPEMMKKFMGLGGPVCVYLDGTPRPGVVVDNFNTDEIMSFEVYGPIPASLRDLRYTGNVPAYALRASWPGDAATCPTVSRSMPAIPHHTDGAVRTGPATPTNAGASATFVVIWTKR